MFLVGRQESQSAGLIELLTVNGYIAKWLPLMTTRLNIPEYVKIQQSITCYEKIIITAPAVIDYLRMEIAKLDSRITVLTPGIASAKKIKEINPRIQLLYPKNGSGIEAIAKELLLNQFIDDEVLVIGGDEINPRLRPLLAEYKVRFNYASIYHRLNIGLENLDVIDKFISNQQIIGIIITSTQIAGYLLECVSRLNLMNRLQEILIISIHPQITAYLSKHGISKVQETFASDNLSILQTIRAFMNE